MRYSSHSSSYRASGRRKMWIFFGAAALLVALGVYRWVKTSNIPVPGRANLTVISGEATVIRADAGPGSALKAGETTVLQRGDEVRTGAEARAKLTFGTEESTELGPKTRLTMLELNQTPLSRSAMIILALHEGKTLTRIQSILFRGVKFAIETAVVTVQAHGTVFQCDALSKSQVYVAAYEGVVSVSMGEQAVELQAGQALDARLGQTLAPMPISATPPAEALGTPTATKAPTADRERTLFPAIVTPTRPGDNVVLHTVQPGETLYSIARQYGVTQEALLAANRGTLRSPDLLRVGQQLRIPR